jgi:NitT/TauT family transport system ATP-binding protein
VALVTHDIEEAIVLADRVVVLSPRPASIARIVIIPEPRPRPRAFAASNEFVELKRQLLDALGMLA